MDLMMSRKEFEELLNINHESERDKRNYLAFYDNDPSYERYTKNIAKLDLITPVVASFANLPLHKKNHRKNMILTLNASGIVTFSHDFQDDCGLPKFPRFLQMPSTMQALCLQLLDWRELVTNIVLSCKAIQRLLSSSRLVWQYVCIKTATGVFENQEKLNHLLTVPCPRSLSWDYAQFSSSNSPLLQYLDHLKAKRHILHSLPLE